MSCADGRIQPNKQAYSERLQKIYDVDDRKGRISDLLSEIWKNHETRYTSSVSTVQDYKVIYSEKTIYSKNSKKIPLVILYEPSGDIKTNSPQREAAVYSFYKDVESQEPGKRPIRLFLEGATSFHRAARETADFFRNYFTQVKAYHWGVDEEPFLQERRFADAFQLIKEERYQVEQQRVKMDKLKEELNIFVHANMHWSLRSREAYDVFMAIGPLKHPIWDLEDFILQTTIFCQAAEKRLRKEDISYKRYSDYIAERTDQMVQFLTKYAKYYGTVKKLTPMVVLISQAAPLNDEINRSLRSVLNKHYHVMIFRHRSS